jgi:hypothetical protein
MLSVSHLTNTGGRVKIVVRNFAGTKFLWVCRLLANCIHIPAEKREGVFCVYSEWRVCQAKEQTGFR